MQLVEWIIVDIVAVLMLYWAGSRLFDGDPLPAILVAIAYMTVRLALLRWPNDRQDAQDDVSGDDGSDDSR